MILVYSRRAVVLVELELDLHLIARQWFATDHAGASAPWRTEHADQKPSRRQLPSPDRISGLFSQERLVGHCSVPPGPERTVSRFTIVRPSEVSEIPESRPWSGPRRSIMRAFGRAVGAVERGWRATFYTTGMEHSPTAEERREDDARGVGEAGQGGAQLCGSDRGWSEEKSFPRYPQAPGARPLGVSAMDLLE